MRRLLLLRHAKAEAATDPLADGSRQLLERGERDARRIGERLAQYCGRPDLILASPAARALQTAQLVAPALGYAPGDIVLERKLYLAEPTTLVDVIAAQDKALESLLVVGHNPGLSELVQALLPSFTIEDLPTAAVVAIGYDGLEDWAGFASIAGRLAYYDFPKNRREPATSR